MSPTDTIDMEAGEKSAVNVAREGDPRASRGRWVLQPVICLLGIAAIFIYTNTKTLASKERLLTNSELIGNTGKHLYLTVVAAILVIIIAVPLGIALTRGPLKRFSGAIMAFSGFGQAAPAVGLVVLFALVFGIGTWPFIAALTVYGILPVLANVVAGLDAVDPRLTEAGRGMGMSSFGVLRSVELPIAVPVMLAGVRTALVLMCGTAAFGGFVGAGGLGTNLNTGIKLGENSLLICGAVMIAMLALILDWLARVFELVFTPKGL